MSSTYDMQHRIELRDIPGGGQGVFSARQFKTGDTISIGVIQKILSKNERGATQIGEKKFVQLAGLMARINHSCDPNCGIRANTTGAYDLVAMKDGLRGEEITYDYAMQNYVVNFHAEDCTCGTPDCRVRITGWKDLPEAKKKAYEGFPASYLLELDKDHAAD